MESIAFSDFASAARAVLRHLHDELGYGLWMVTRTTCDDQVVLHALDEEFGVQDGAVFTWSGTFCTRMVAGEAPRVAPDTEAVPAYRDAPEGAGMGIRTYVGVPLRTADDALFGTLCAIDRAPREPLTEAELKTVELFAGLLSTLLAHELARDQQLARAERAERLAMRDELTALPNRRAWEIALGAEEARCGRYGSPAAVLAVDLDGLKAVNDADGHAAGDELLRVAARTLSTTLRPSDVVARLGGDEFGVLLLECDRSTAAKVAARVEAELAAAGADASVGVASRGRGVPLAAAAIAADAVMYARKRERQASAGA